MRHRRCGHGRQAFEALGATVDQGLEGYAKNCTYWLGTGTASKVDVFYVGTVDRWEEVKSDWDAKEGGIVEVEDVGDGAYEPTKYHGGRDLVFLVGEHIFSIVGFAGADEASLAKVETAVLELANAIVAKHS